LVIFLILGVAIWGGDPQAASTGNSNVTRELEKAASPIEELQVEPLPIGDQLSVTDLLDLDTSRSSAVEDPGVPVSETPVNEASAPPAPGPAAARSAAAEIRYYTVQDGDILEEIARRELGRRDRWREIEALNPGVEERNLKLGTRLRLPLRRADSRSSSQGWFLYTVRKNDNPSRISERLYGDQGEADTILKLNPGLDPLKMRPGSEIRVPFKQ
jgi:nucleoid-associated protein YgaU